MTRPPGPTNTVLDVPGLRVGHATRTGDGWLTGTTVVLPPAHGAVAGVDVRGGGPGTRETDLLDPRNLVERVHAVVLGGGSALGLAAADGVVAGLLDDGVGFPMGAAPGDVVPIVPAAILFDLGRGGTFRHHPGAETGAQAYAAASGSTDPTDPTGLHGVVGAGTGARAGGLKGAVGSASSVLADGTRVGALVAVNAVGSCVDPATGELYGAAWCRPDDLPSGGLRRPDPRDLARATDLAAALEADRPATLATTIGVVATDLPLTKAACAKVAGVGHDGLARAIAPVHSMFDGDTLFALSTAAPGAAAPDPAAYPLVFHDLLTEAAHCVTRAVVRAMLAATSVTTPWGTMRSYAEAFPSAFPDGSPGTPAGGLEDRP
ncbi:P1 family peptidase [Nocardioides zeae]|uniref:P1 family peptidase n=1 Tax=Nocardioides imazamoxiresistens TaxID=3231893 RepID=A0ABU3PU13_9ACTN|nr:P1 family peptidase [Nocardioides zeae]MDT9592711.1 P1 family peptidase [Nocardioides zeae]